MKYKPLPYRPLPNYFLKRKIKKVSKGPTIKVLRPKPEIINETIKRINIGGYEFFQNVDRGIFPVFSYIIRGRINKKKATNTVVCGEPGEGKSYMASDSARVIDRKMSIDQIVFNYGMFLKSIIKLGMGKPIVFDEPSYAMGKRDWYKDVNKSLVLTMESMRFKVHPVYIPIINLNLLDKNIRAYLVQFMIQVIDRGRGMVYRLKSKQHKEGYYRYHLCNLKYGLFDNDQCKRDSCLDCSKIENCSIFRAQYERKKRDIQDSRYLDSLTKFSKAEAKNLSDKDLENLLLTVIPQIVNEKGKPDSTNIRIILEDKWDVIIGRNRGYKLAKGLLIRYPKRFNIEMA